MLCALYPRHFTSIADVGKLQVLHRHLHGSPKDHPVRAHQSLRQKFDAALSRLAATHPADAVERICLPWLVYERIADGASGDGRDTAPEPLHSLTPQPAALRRKGLSALKGSFQAVLGYLPELQDGLTRDEFIEVIRLQSPEVGSTTVSAILHVVARELDLCRRDGNVFRLSARGLNLLETQDPDELADHLLTRILGVDHLLLALASGPAPRRKADLIEHLRLVNPGWSTPTIPSTMLTWLASLDVLHVDEQRDVVLTERGRRWAELVTWAPEALLRSADLPDEPSANAGSTSTPLPDFPALWASLSALVKGRLVFERSLAAELHAGLWFHPVRHFAVLTGISGSGKTQLALNYALALCGQGPESHDQVHVIPVQPGWYDPGPLLGHPDLLQSSYRSAPFLDLLLRAADDPARPYVAILDEMNLSHPEQYLATVLSAMETRGWVDLHGLGEDARGVPGRVRYPANLAIIGTLNMDETTHGLSDKVLDRAHVLEFWKIDVEAHPRWRDNRLPPALSAKARTVLVRLAEALSPVRLHFGWRTIGDAISYLEFHGTVAPDEDGVLDRLVYAKLLPKLRGERTAAFQQALRDLLAVCTEHGLGRCCDKLRSMQDDLDLTGSSRFWR